VKHAAPSDAGALGKMLVSVLPISRENEGSLDFILRLPPKGPALDSKIEVHPPKFRSAKRRRVFLERASQLVKEL